MERRGFFARLAGAFAGLLAWREARPAWAEGQILVVSPGLSARLHVEPIFPDGRVMVTGARGSISQVIQPLTECRLLAICQRYRRQYGVRVTEIHLSSSGAKDYFAFTGWRH